jgi:NAD(P)-dependent dehydrogenase (short-subunit alcohol dehydrogenase family)
MDLELAGKAFIITGGTEGLGLALAQSLIAEGAKVAICGRRADKVAEAAALLGPKALAIQTDVTVTEQLDAFFDQAVAAFGRLDGVVNNAGRSAATPLLDSTDEEWREDYELKVIAAVHLIRRAIPELIKHRGAVLNILAVKGKAPDAGSTPTAASRAAGLAMTKALSGELAPHGVRVNAILIGLIKSGQWTRRADAMSMAHDDLYGAIVQHQGIPLGRVGEASEFADLATYLLSARASYLTGVGINLDGGLSPLP